VVQRESFIFLSLLVNQLAPWIGCVFLSNNEVHRSNEALKQLGFAFLSYLEHGDRSLSVISQLRQICCRWPLPSYWRFFLSLIKRN